MKWYDVVVEGYDKPLTAEQIAELFRKGRLRRTDGCREVGRGNGERLMSCSLF